MKAHRREAKNCALIECAQVAAEKAGWPIRDELKRMSSRTGGGGERAAIPRTVTDEHGRIGERRRRAPMAPPPGPAPRREPVVAVPTAPRPASQPAPSPPPPAAARPATDGERSPARPAANRFSSIFGTRRR